MSFPIAYQKQGLYDSLDTGITVETILRYGNLETVCQAKVDTGSHVCLFSRTFADSLEIDVESGYRQEFSTLAGSLVAYAHEIRLVAMEKAR